MTDTTHLALPLIAAAQAQKHVTHNEALAALDCLVQLAVLERDRDTPPSAPGEGDRYLVGAAPTGAFAGQAGALAAFDAGAWRFFTPRAGWTAFVTAEGGLLVYDGAAWVGIEHVLRTLANLDRLGLGTAPDDTNRLAVKLNAALFTALDAVGGGSGDLRLVLNKETASDTVSQLYQSGYSGRAEIGLTGGDDLEIKVSADGSAWMSALRIDRATGALFAGAAALTRPAGSMLSVNADADAPAVVLKRSGVTVGSIAVTATGTAYNTTSDARLKRDFRPVNGASAAIDALVVGRFAWSEAPEAPTDIGLLAQDAAAIVPQAVTVGDGDPEARPGDPDFRPWSIDYSRLVPLLLAEVQDLRRRLAALEG